MKDKLYKMYIDNIKKEDFIKYVKQNNLNVSNNDIDYTYNYMKNIKDFSNIDKHIKTIKNNVSADGAKFIDTMFNKYKHYL